MRRRQFLLRAAAGALLLGAPTVMRGAMQHAPFDAWVGRRDDSAAPRYRRVADAVAAAPRSGGRPFRIGIGAGVWHEKLVVDRPNVHLIGAHRQGCVLRFDAAAGMAGPDGQSWGTGRCASLTVRAPGFRAENLTIANGFDYLAHLRAPQFEPIGPNGAQAVALMLDQGSDRAWLREVDLIGHQDTLFVDAGLSLFERCRISGSVDFVFGAGRACFDRCELVSRHRPGKSRQGYIAVPSTPVAQSAGLVFARCRLLREAAVADASVALGRAWRPGRRFADGHYGDPDALGHAAFVDCWMDAHVAPEGWDAMDYTTRDGRRVALAPESARLFEYGSRGPGAHRSTARRQLRPDDALRLMRPAVLQGWEPVA